MSAATSLVGATMCDDVYYDDVRLLGDYDVQFDYSGYIIPSLFS